MENLWLILIAAISYLLGSIPFSYIVSKRYGKNLFEEGSGNVGAMNTWRATKKISPFILSLAGDGGKAALAIFLCKFLSFLGYNLWVGIAVAGFFVILGHNYPFSLKFKGGRGLACLVGILLVLNWLLLFIGLGVVLFSIFAVEFLLKRKIILEGTLKQRFKELFLIIGSQVIGRVAGIILAIVSVYFFDSMTFWQILPALALALIKHINILKEPESRRRID